MIAHGRLPYSSHPNTVQMFHVKHSRCLFASGKRNGRWDGGRFLVQMESLESGMA